MNNIMREETKKLIQAALEERGLTNLCGMFSAQHNVPRGTHKIGAVGGGVGDMLKSTYDTDNDGRVGQAANADTVDGKHASDLAPAAHGHAQSDVTNLVTDLAGKAAVSHAHAATDITSATLDGDRLPALSTTKRGGVKATGTPSGKFLKDDDTWATPAGGDLPTPVNIALLAYSTIWTDMPAGLTEFPYEPRTKADLTNAIQFRVVVRIYVAGYAGSVIKLQYGTTESSWSDLSGNIAIDATGTVVTSWANVPAGAKGDVYIRIVGIYGDGIVDPRFSHIDLQVK